MIYILSSILSIIISLIIYYIIFNYVKIKKQKKKLNRNYYYNSMTNFLKRKR